MIPIQQFIDAVRAARIAYMDEHYGHIPNSILIHPDDWDDLETHYLASVPPMFRSRAEDRTNMWGIPVTEDSTIPRRQWRFV